MSLLFDPRVFNYIIMVLYLTNAGQYMMRGYYADGCYWLSALAITATVTFGYPR